MLLTLVKSTPAFPESPKISSIKKIVTTNTATNTKKSNSLSALVFSSIKYSSIFYTVNNAKNK